MMIIFAFRLYCFLLLLVLLLYSLVKISLQVHILIIGLHKLVVEAAFLLLWNNLQWKPLFFS